jgi:anti-anti-sigma regulatory factor
VKKKKSPSAEPSKPFELAPHLSVAQAADLHRDLKARVADGNGLILDGGRVEQIDTAVLQLLASTWQTCLRQGTPCSWQAVSENLRLSATLIGVGDALHLPHA